MKKKIYYLLFTLCLLLYGMCDNVFALEYETDDIPVNSYIIGAHIYSSDTVLTTEHIMLAAKSIDGDDISNMVIYYKSPRGKWIDGMSGDSVNISDEVDVSYIDLKEHIDYGDANSDGKINNKDVTAIFNYLNGVYNEKFNVFNADVNGDGEVNNADYKLLFYYLSGFYSEAKLPEKPLGTTYIIDYFVDGDSYYIDYTIENGKITKPSDPTKEGYEFKGWYIDQEYKTAYDFNLEVTSNITLYAKFENSKYGDANNDGTVNGEDAIALGKYLNNIEYKGFNEKGADINGDGKVNNADLVLLKKYLAKVFPDAKLPEEPLGTTYIIDYLVDSVLYYIDYTIENVKITKPSDPTKEGYEFKGWYTDKEYKTIYDFNSGVTSNITLYAKFEHIKYGDANNDGVVDGKDAIALGKHLNGIEYKGFNEKGADINGDGKVNNADLVLLKKYLAKVFPDAKLPEEPLGTTYIIDYYIDTDTDAESYYVDYTLENGKSTLPNDPIKEGYEFKGWYTDQEYKTIYDFNLEVTSNITLYAKFENN